MQKILKRFAVWGIGLRYNVFDWARTSITALYLLMIILVLSAYSAALYFLLLKNIQEKFDAVTNSMIHHQLIDHAMDGIQIQIFLIDGGILIIAALASYWLAGITLKPIRRALEAQEAFSADASHELRTPLAVMKTDIEVLLRGNVALPDEAVTVLRSNLEEITSLTIMTNELLELSRGRQTLQQRIALHTLLEEEIAVLDSLARQKHVKLAYGSDCTSVMEGDRSAIVRVIKNIIANAITYTPKGGSVVVSLKELSQQAVIKVTDTGIGISEHDLEHIFKRFYKADNARTESVSGSGLGLAIAKQIIEHHRGTISVKSVLKKGTTVTVTLPLLA